MDFTTIRISPQTKGDLNEFREHKNESYEEILHKLVYIAKTAEKDPKLSQKTVQEIEAARKRIKNGAYHSEEDVKKMLGL